MYKPGGQIPNRKNTVNLYNSKNTVVTKKPSNFFQVTDQYVQWGTKKYYRGEQRLTTYDKFIPPSSVMRGGIIPIVNDVYGFGVSTLYNELSDFGGGLKRIEDRIIGALRELFEESLGVFGNITIDQIPNDSVVVYDNYMFIIFLPIQGQTTEYYSSQYLDALNRRPDPSKEEVSSIIWLTFEGMNQCVTGFGPYKVYNLIIPAIKNYILNTEPHL
ncbi:Diadenosine tetraphosphate (Ap4A) hydrolase [Orpheovirus IHUMI-LCC2]|uniref:Diadenosine tetraphosphate (Ap4A) hydrolase n=1 Tax=Orpheovirus IHUMI-LCC2 TaxID=2023057 RepID=A0A2I2L5T3_9VIRU|nr:Diadenosine tetraphosphate (Ap4A) hydrolase [Orpheovirus IHUMI-LCC2]SNW62908.1 Diadenosine tetraphosphate (Ap4A) hydrolase [Orpheovirus IHUMI-LCC2]